MPDARDPVEIYRSYELEPVPLARTVREAGLIVVAQVHKQRASVTKDGCFVQTDYTLVITSVVAGKVPSADKPGAQPLILRIEGGDLTVEGKRVTARVAQMAPPKNGRELILLLKPTEEKGVYILSTAFFGAFSADGERIQRLMTPPFENDFPSESKEAFIAELQRLKSER